MEDNILADAFSCTHFRMLRMCRANNTLSNSNKVIVGTESGGKDLPPTVGEIFGIGNSVLCMVD